MSNNRDKFEYSGNSFVNTSVLIKAFNLAERVRSRPVIIILYVNLSKLSKRARHVSRILIMFEYPSQVLRLSRFYV